MLVPATTETVAGTKLTIRVEPRLERELHTKLHRARIANAADAAEVCAAGDVQTGETTEVRVVEDIEHFGAQLQSS